MFTIRLAHIYKVTSKLRCKQSLDIRTDSILLRKLQSQHLRLILLMNYDISILPISYFDGNCHEFFVNRLFLSKMVLGLVSLELLLLLLLVKIQGKRVLC